jgi:hypothetical protein
MKTELNVNFAVSYFHCLLFFTRLTVGVTVILAGVISRHGENGQC